MPHSPIIRSARIYSGRSLKPRSVSQVTNSNAETPLPEIPARPNLTIAAVPAVTVLVINASHEMATRITQQLHTSVPHATILYAPTVAVAKLMLARRRFDVVISNNVLPDGNICQLQGTLEKFSPPPELVVAGEHTIESIKTLSCMGYALTAQVTLPGSSKTSSAQPLEDSVRNLGADLRDALNNPLQEIIAMAFVAQASGSISETGCRALEAIEHAAKGMAKVVNVLEEKIRKTVVPE